MDAELESRFVVRLGCGHEALEVVPVNETPTAVGHWFTCNECGRRRQIIDSFRVEP
jgi:hypothetical protein